MSSDGKTASIETDVLGKPAIPDYEMFRVIGQGAYGDVWLARGLTGIFRAIKIVWRNRFTDTAPYDREFRGVSEFAPISLANPGQLALLHIGRNEAGGFFYYVMELADDAETGPEIRPDHYVPNTLRELRRRRGRLPADECLDLAVKLTEGLAYLHDRNLIHRDIKPSNVVVVGGVPKLADIGLVSTENEARTFVGTEGYLPPEGPVNAASDVYSLGKLLYELATGRDRRDFPSLPEGLDAFPDRQALLRLNDVILRSCDLTPARRYPAAGYLLQDLRLLQKGQKVRSVTRGHAWRALGIAGALIGCIGLAYQFWWSPRFGSRTIADAPAFSRHSIGVLPFTNLSPDPANAFFADGVHEDLIINLTKIHELRVAPRSSVVAYRGKTDDLAAIGRDLAVTHLLEGTVRRSGQQIRVTATLVLAKEGNIVWADTFDGDLADVFAIQSDLAERIAKDLQAKLSANERRLIGRRATENQEAYDLYLQARARDETLGNEGTLDHYLPVVALYEQAVTKDPRFALAYSELCKLHVKLYWYKRLDSTPERLAMAEAAGQAAVRLAPNDPETKLALGKLAYNGHRDYERALAEFKAAEAGMPNDSQVLFAIGLVLRRLGKWDEAPGYFYRASALNPRDAMIGLCLVETLSAMRRYSQAGNIASAYLARYPNLRSLAALQVTARYEVDENRASYLSALESLPTNATDPHNVAARYHSAFRRGNWAVADEALADPRITDVFDGSGASDMINDVVVLARARVAFLRGQPEVARDYAEQALVKYRAGTWTGRQIPWVGIKMAEADAYCGRPDAAIRGIEAALAAIKSSRDAGDGVLIQPLIGRIHLILNRRTDALSILEKMTGGACELGPQQIRHDAFWSRLAGDSRFEQILQSTKPL